MGFKLLEEFNRNSSDKKPKSQDSQLIESSETRIDTISQDTEILSEEEIEPKKILHRLDSIEEELKAERERNPSKIGLFAIFPLERNFQKVYLEELAKSLYIHIEISNLTLKETKGKLNTLSQTLITFTKTFKNKDEMLEITNAYISECIATGYKRKSFYKEKIEVKINGK